MPHHKQVWYQKAGLKLEYHTLILMEIYLKCLFQTCYRFDIFISNLPYDEACLLEAFTRPLFFVLKVFKRMTLKHTMVGSGLRLFGNVCAFGPILSRPQHKAGLKWKYQTCSSFEIDVLDWFPLQPRFDSASFKPAFCYQTCLWWGLPLRPFEGLFENH